MKTKIFVLILLLLCSVTFGACGNKANLGVEPTKGVTPAQRPKATDTSKPTKTPTPTATPTPIPAMVDLSVGEVLPEKWESITMRIEGDTLVISGNGILMSEAIEEWAENENVPDSVFDELIKHVVIEDGITGIGTEALEGCEIESIEMADSVVSIGGGAFESCEQLKSVKLSNNMRYIGVGAFMDCYNLSYIEIPKSVRTIGSEAFIGTKWLENMQKTNSMVIVNNILIDATRVEGEIEVPEQVTYISGMAFSEGAIIKNSRTENGMLIVNGILVSGVNAKGDVVIPDDVVCIADMAFIENDEINSITIPETVTYIGEGSFAYCYNLTEVSISDSAKALGMSCFESCVRLNCVTMPSEVEWMGEAIFYGCEELKTIKLPDNIRSIPAYMFEGSGLVSVEIPTEVALIGEGAFGWCMELKQVKLPENLKEIGAFAFENCGKLMEIQIPESVIKKGTDALFRCGAFATPTPIVTPANTPTPMPKVSLEELISVSVDGIIMVDGEKCHAIWGETGALVWKYVEATFDTEEHYETAFVVDASDVSSTGPIYGDAVRVSSWKRWFYFDFEKYPIVHAGEDVFEIKGRAYGEWYHYFIMEKGMKTIDVGERLSTEGTSFERASEFNDGYAICRYYTNKKWKPVFIDTKGNLEVKSIVEQSGAGEYGKYSDGVFYNDYAFYDIELNEVLNLKGKNWGTIYHKAGIYAPYFEDGVCRLITYKNGKYWILDIDKSGNVLTEPEEFNILWLNTV